MKATSSASSSDLTLDSGFTLTSRDSFVYPNPEDVVIDVQEEEEFDPRQYARHAEGNLSK